MNVADELYRLPSGGRIRAAGLYPVVVAGATGGVLGSLWIATQWMAYRWRFAPSLGHPWLALPGQWVFAAAVSGLSVSWVLARCSAPHSGNGLLCSRSEGSPSSR